MHLDKDLALLIMLASAFVLEDCKDEQILSNMKNILEKYNVDIDSFDDYIQNEGQAVSWFEKTANRLQLAIEEYEALERGGD